MNLLEFNALIRLIITKTELTEKEISKKLKRNPTYISQLRNAAKTTGEDIPQTAIDLINTHFGKYIGSNVSLEITPEVQSHIMVGIAARQQVHGRYIAEIFAKSSGTSVTKVLHEMEQLEREKAELLLKTYG